MGNLKEQISSCFSIRHVHMAWESPSRGDTTWIEQSSQLTPNCANPQEFRGAPMCTGAENRSHVTAELPACTEHLRHLMHRKKYFGFYFFFPAGCFPVRVHASSGNAIPLCPGKKEEILGEFGRSSFYPNLTKRFSLPAITHLSTQKLQIWTFQDQILLPLLALRTFPLIKTVKTP